MQRVHVSKVAELVLSEITGFWDRLLFGVRSWFRDEYYVPIGLDELHDWLKIWKLQELPKLAYTSETFDCDDFGAYFKAWLTLKSHKNCVGEAIGEIIFPEGRALHEWNIVLVKHGSLEIVFVEPQIGQVFKEHTYDYFYYNLKWVIW